MKSTRLLKMKQIQGIKWIKVGSRSVFLTFCNTSSSAKMLCYLHVATLLPFLQVFLNMFHSFTSWYFPCHLQVIHFIKKRSNMGLQKNNHRRLYMKCVKCMRLKSSEILSNDTSKVKVVAIPLCHSASLREKSAEVAGNEMKTSEIRNSK